MGMLVNLLGQLDAARRAYERGDLCEVLSSWSAFDSAGDIDHPRSDSRDSWSDVQRSKTSGQNQAVQGGHAIEDVVGYGLAGTSGLARGIGIDQDRIGEAAGRPSSGEIVRHATPGRGPIQTKCPNDLEVVECKQVFRRFTPVQLDDPEAKSIRYVRHYGRGPVDKHADSGCGGRQRGDDLSSFSWLDVTPRSRIKVEADPIRAGQCASNCFIDARQTADLYADHGLEYSEVLGNRAKREENRNANMRLL